MKHLPEIRCDDVLQTLATATKHQLWDINERNLFDLFKRTDEIFEKYDYPMTLAVLQEGVVNQPWVEFIIERKHRYNIQLHGKTHKNYKNVSRIEFHTELKEAKLMLELMFDTEITIWYPPWGRKGTPEWGQEECQKIGLTMYEQEGKVDAKFWLKEPEKYPHINFHYWNDAQVGHIKEILCRLHAPNS